MEVRQCKIVHRHQLKFLSIKLLQGKRTAVTKYTQNTLNLFCSCVMKFQRMKSSIMWWINLCTSKQQVCVLDAIRLRCAKNWTHTPSASGYYSRQAGNLTDKSLVVLKKLKLTTRPLWIFK